MGSKWREVTLKEMGIRLIDCVHKTPTAVENGYPYIGIPQLKDGHIDFNADPRLITEEDLQSWSEKAKPKRGDIIVSRRCNPGESAVVVEQTKFALGQNLVLLRAEKDIVFPSFFRWLVRSRNWWGQVNKYINVGAVFDSLRCADIPKFKLPLPPLPEQKAIARILGSLDDKIELNRKMNETLEQMAQALFRSWFVDFDPVIDKALEAGNAIPEPLRKRAARRAALGKKRRPLPPEIRDLFPDAFTFHEEMGWIPQGWEVGELSSYVQLIGGGTPKTSVEEYWDGDIPWFSVVDAPNNSDVFVLRTQKNITITGLENSSARILRKGITIISARGTVGKCAVVGTPMAMNQSCYGVQGNDSVPDYFVYYLIRQNVADLESRGHGSVFNTITRDTFSTIRISFPGVRISQEFDEIVKDFFDQILANNRQIFTLTALRDTLLPKLISGEIRVGEVEKEAHQA